MRPAPHEGFRPGASDVRSLNSVLQHHVLPRGESWEELQKHWLTSPGRSYFVPCPQTSRFTVLCRLHTPRASGRRRV